METTSQQAGQHIRVAYGRYLEELGVAITNGTRADWSDDMFLAVRERLREDHRTTVDGHLRALLWEEHAEHPPEHPPERPSPD